MDCTVIWRLGHGRLISCFFHVCLFVCFLFFVSLLVMYKFKIMFYEGPSTALLGYIFYLERPKIAVKNTTIGKMPKLFFHPQLHRKNVLICIK